LPPTRGLQAARHAGAIDAWTRHRYMRAAMTLVLTRSLFTSRRRRNDTARPRA